VNKKYGETGRQICRSFRLQNRPQNKADLTGGRGVFEKRRKNIKKNVPGVNKSEYQ
jgi:hypothetical protein